MATWTGVQLRNAVLEYLGIKGRGQSAPGEDATLVDGVYASLYPQLRKLGLAPFDDDTIPEWSQQPLVCVLAAECIPYYGFTGAREASLAAHAQKGFRQLEEQNEGDGTSLETRIVNF